MKILNNMEEYKEFVEDNKRLVLVDFFATWCGPCKMLAPILEQIANENEADFDVCKVDIDENFELAKMYGVMSIPTLVFIKDGKELHRIVGFNSKDYIVNTAKDLMK